MAKKKELSEESGETVSLASHTVVTALRHNGKHYHPQSTVDLSADEAKPLIDAGVVKPAAK